MSRRFRQGVLSGSLCECVDAHSEILALIAARDATAARERMRTHIQALGRYVEDREHTVERRLLLGRQD
jgi:DNA-binding GntR family transcriptional regulator